MYFPKAYLHNFGHRSEPLATNGSNNIFFNNVP